MTGIICARCASPGVVVESGVARDTIITWHRCPDCGLAWRFGNLPEGVAERPLGEIVNWHLPYPLCRVAWYGPETPA